MRFRILSALALLLALAAPASAVTFVPQCRVSGVLQTCVGQLAPASGGAPDLSSVAANLVLAGPCSGGAASATLRALCAADMPTGIDATKIGAGSVDNTEYGYLNGVTSAIQTQLDGKQSTLTLPLSVANGGTATATGQLVPTGDNAQTLGDSTHRFNLFSTSIQSGTSGLAASSSVPNSGSPIAFDLNSTVTLSASGHRLLRIRNGSTEAYGFGNATFFPGATNTYGLGSSGARWLEVVSQRLVADTVGPSGGQQHTLPLVTSDTVVLVNNPASLQSKNLQGNYALTGTYTLGGSATLTTSLALSSDNTYTIGTTSSRLSTLHTYNVHSGNTTLSHISSVANGGSAVGFDFNTTNPLTSAGAKIARFRNNGTELMNFNSDGSFRYATFLVNVTPGADNTYALGNLSARWSAVATPAVNSGASQLLVTSGVASSGGTALAVNTSNTLDNSDRLLSLLNAAARQFIVSGKGIIGQLIGSNIASASTIAPVNAITHITGTAAIDTITAPAVCASSIGCIITLIPDGLFTWTTSGNISLAGSAVVGRAITFTYDPGTSKWYPSYT